MQANMASCQISEDVLGLFAGPKPQARLSDRRRKRPIKRSKSEDGHGRTIESLDLQAPSTQRRTRKKTIPPDLVAQGTPQQTGGLPDGAGTAIKRERARGWPLSLDVQGLGRLACMAGWLLV